MNDIVFRSTSGFDWGRAYEPMPPVAAVPDPSTYALMLAGPGGARPGGAASIGSLSAPTAATLAVGRWSTRRGAAALCAFAHPLGGLDLLNRPLIR